MPNEFIIQSLLQYYEQVNSEGGGGDTWDWPIPQNGCAFYHPFDQARSVLPTGQNVTQGGGTYTTFAGVPCLARTSASDPPDSISNVQVPMVADSVDGFYYFTVGGWFVNANTGTSATYVFSLGTGSDWYTSSYRLSLQKGKDEIQGIPNAPNIDAIVYNQSALSNIKTIRAQITRDDKWHFFIIRFNGHYQAVEFYIDNTLIMYSDWTDAYPFMPTSTCSITWMQDGGVGYVREGFVYNRLLTTTEMADIYDATRPPPQTITVQSSFPQYNTTYSYDSTTKTWVATSGFYIKAYDTYMAIEQSDSRQTGNAYLRNDNSNNIYDFEGTVGTWNHMNGTQYYVQNTSVTMTFS